MEFDYTEEQKLIRGMVSQFGDEWVRPILADMEEKENIPQDVLAKLSESGLLGLAVPELNGGSEVPLLTQVIVAEALGKISASLAVSVVFRAFLLPAALVACGTDEQRSQWLPELATGKIAGTVLIEPVSCEGKEGGVSPSEIRAERDKQGWRLDGDANWVVNGQGTCLAYLFARSADDGLKSFLVTPGSEGIEVSPVVQKLGLRPVNFAQWTFGSSVGFLPFSAGLDAKEGTRRSIRWLADLFLAAIGVGLTQNCLEVSVDYAKERKQFGRPIGSFQLVQGMIAEMVFDVDAARLSVYRAAAEAEGRNLELEPCSPWIARARSLASEAALKAGYDSIQVHGGYGFSGEYPAERLFRDARALALINGGTGNLLRVLAEPVLDVVHELSKE